MEPDPFFLIRVPYHKWLITVPRLRLLTQNFEQILLESLCEEAVIRLQFSFIITWRPTDWTLKTGKLL